MKKSNIVVGSNVFLSRTEDPRFDPEFVAQVLDYEFLNRIKKGREVDSRVQLLSKDQLKIVHAQQRCTFAKNDPCVGPTNNGKVVCKCINADCDGLFDRPSFHGVSPWKGCNPGLTEEYIKEWSPNPNNKELYGNPKALRRYFIVDLISDDEMKKYYPDPENYGEDFPTPPAPVYTEEEVKNPNGVQIDPKTGRRMVIKGYERLKYPFEEDGFGEPIWGFVEEIEAEKTVSFIRKAPKIEKIKSKVIIPREEKRIASDGIDHDYEHKADYERLVNSIIIEKMKLSELDENNFGTCDTVILLDNPAEAAFVSSTFLVTNIKHGYSDKDGITLALIDDYGKFSSKKNVLITNTVLQKECKENNVQAWKALSQLSEINELILSDRDYFLFKYGNNDCRWSCRGPYGVTHVCMNPEDLESINSLDDGLYQIHLEEDGGRYSISEKDGNIIGYCGESFIKLLESLKTKGEIAALPAIVKGMALNVKNGEIEILGMGHLKIIEY